MRTFLYLGILLTCSIPQAMAECVRPKVDFSMPAGAEATEAELTTAQSELLKFDKAVGDYLRCLESETTQRSVGKTPEAREAISKEFVSNYNAAADQVAGLGECFNAQMQKFRTGSSGKGAKSVDCSSFVSAAAARSTLANTTPRDARPNISRTRTLSNISAMHGSVWRSG